VATDVLAVAGVAVVGVGVALITTLLRSWAALLAASWAAFWMAIKMKKMSEIIDRNKAVRARLIKQAADPIGMDDYKQQLRAYQEIILEVIDIQAELCVTMNSTA
jgi:hypothetical protein